MRYFLCQGGLQTAWYAAVFRLDMTIGMTILLFHDDASFQQ
jgi:hypothetical protein